MKLAAKSKSHVLALEDVRIDGKTQSRADLDQRIIEDYADDIRDGAEFPPIVVFFDGKSYWLADGFHRWHATRKADHENITCEVRKGTLSDARLFSAGANAAHGLRRSNADKRAAVLMLLSDEAWQSRSDRWIADACGVSRELVGDVRQVSDSDTCNACRCIRVASVNRLR